jgi:hypothetical protein
MNHKNPPTIRLGRMARWHKNTTYAILLSCAVTGVAWFVLGEIFEFLPPQLRFWWITHGLSGLLTFFIIGSALSQHVLVTWRSRRNRLAGALSTLIFAFISLSTALLYYGNDLIRDPAKWVHIGLGLALCLIFPWHIVKGRRCKPQHRLISHHR